MALRPEQTPLTFGSDLEKWTDLGISVTLSLSLPDRAFFFFLFFFVRLFISLEIMHGS